MSQYIEEFIFVNDRRAVDVHITRHDCAALNRQIDTWLEYIGAPGKQVGNYPRSVENLDAAVKYARRAADDVGC